MCLNIRDDSFCNYNHIAQVTEYFLIKEADVCVNYLLYYNLLYKLAQNLEFPYVQHFFLTLFNCSYSPNHIAQDSFYKINKYCEILSFFEDLSQAILIGPKGFDKEKFEMKFKPPGIDSLINGAIKLSDLDMLFGENGTTVQDNNRNSFLEDELDGVNLDIDNLHPILSSKTPYEKKIPSITFKDTPKPISDTVIAKYPSLREKYPPKTESSVNEILVTDGRENDITPTSKGKNKLTVLPPIFGQPKVNVDSRGSQGYGQRTILPSPNASNLSNQSLQSSQSKKLLGIRPGTSLVEKLPTEENKKEITKLSYEPSRTDGFVSKSVKEFSNISKDRGSTAIHQKRVSGLGGGSRQDSSRQGYTPRKSKDNPTKPERITLASALMNDAMTVEDAEVLNALYPISNEGRDDNKIDKEAKSEDYTVSNIKITDTFSLPACNLLESLFSRLLESQVEVNHDEIYEKDEQKGKKLRYEMNRKLGQPNIDYSHFWDAIFNTKGKLFERIMKVIA